MRWVRTGCVLMFALPGCNSAHDAELAQARAEADAAQAEVADLQAQLSATKAELKTAQALVDSMKSRENAPAIISAEAKPAVPAVTGAAALGGTWDIVTDDDPTFSFAGAAVQIVMDEKDQGDMLVRLPSRDGFTPGMTLAFVINKVDTTQNPSAIILVSTLDFKDRHGIYQLDGNTLKLSIAPPDKPAPTDYKYQEGKTYKVMVLRRQSL